jgi:hypothetical protein
MIGRPTVIISPPILPKIWVTQDCLLVGLLSSDLVGRLSFQQLNTRIKVQSLLHIGDSTLLIDRGQIGGLDCYFTFGCLTAECLGHRADQRISKIAVGDLVDKEIARIFAFIAIHVITLIPLRRAFFSVRATLGGSVPSTGSTSTPFAISCSSLE